MFWRVEENPTPSGPGLLDQLIYIIVSVVMFGLFFMPIKEYVQEAVRPTVRALLQLVGLG